MKEGFAYNVIPLLFSGHIPELLPVSTATHSLMQYALFEYTVVRNAWIGKVTEIMRGQRVLVSKMSVLDRCALR